MGRIGAHRAGGHSRFELPAVAEPPLPPTFDSSGEHKQQDKRTQRNGFTETTPYSKEQNAQHSSVTASNDQYPVGDNGPAGELGGEDQVRTGMLPVEIVVSTATAVVVEPDKDEEEYPTAEVVLAYDDRNAHVKIPLLCCAIHFPAKACSKKAVLAYALILLAVIIATAISVGGAGRNSSQPTGSETGEMLPAEARPSPAPSAQRAAGETSDPTGAPISTTPSASPAAATISPTDVCTDNHQHCSQRASTGECRTDPDHMLTACKYSCGVCSGAFFFEFRSEVNNNYCLDVKGSATSNLTPIQLHECNGTPAQLFRIDEDGRLRSQLSASTCIEMDPNDDDALGVFVFVHSACHDTWTILPEASDRASESPVFLRNDGDNMCIAADLGAYQYEITEATPTKRGGCNAYSPNSEFVRVDVKY